MATQRITQQVAEVLRQEDNEGRITQMIVEVLRETPQLASGGWGHEARVA